MINYVGDSPKRFSAGRRGVPIDERGPKTGGN